MLLVILFLTDIKMAAKKKNPKDKISDGLFCFFSINVVLHQEAKSAEVVAEHIPLRSAWNWPWDTASAVAHMGTIRLTLCCRLPRFRLLQGRKDPLYTRLAYGGCLVKASYY